MAGRFHGCGTCWCPAGGRSRDQVAQYAQEDDVQSTLLSLRRFSWLEGGETHFGELH